MTRFIAVFAALVSFSLPSLSADLDAVLDARPDKLKARDIYRHPKETLEFFGIEEGMTIIDVLPGEWYGRILAPLIGPEGTYIGSRYSVARYKKMLGDRYTSEWIAKENTFPQRWDDMVADYAEAAPKTGFMRTLEAPVDMFGTVDAYLFFRALHHINKFDSADLDAAAEEAFNLLKAGGIVGVVQHRAKEDRDDEWARGFNGYVKQSRVVEAFTKAGFVLEGALEINANPKDQATTGDYVWRLPPSLSGDDATRDARAAIGESDRMTLKFRKPE